MPKVVLLVVVSVLFSGGSAFADDPNKLDPTKIGSGAITTGVDLILSSVEEIRNAA